MDCKKEENSAKCPCTAEDCQRRGECCECMRYHIAKETLPACMKKLGWLQTTNN